MIGRLPPPTAGFFRGQTRIFLPTFVRELICSVGQIAVGLSGNGIDNLAKCQFIRANCIFRLLSLLNVNVYSIPFDDIARFIEQRISSNKKPSIDSVEAAMSRFRLSPLARSQTHLPPLRKTVAVVGMNRSCPAPSLRLLCGHTRVVKPALIQEVDVAI